MDKITTVGAGINFAQLKIKIQDSKCNCYVAFIKRFADFMKRQPIDGPGRLSPLEKRSSDLPCAIRAICSTATQPVWSAPSKNLNV